MDPRGTVVLVTGGARGIGLACVHALATRGARVCVGDLEPGQDLPEDVAYWELDVRDRQTFARVAAEIENTVGPIDILVNNAGLMPVGEVLDHTEATDRLQVDVNLHGVLNGVHAVLGGMLQRERGHIVNIASLAGRIPTPYASVYSATKFAVVGLTESLRHEHIHSGVQFSTVMPGYVDTGLISGLTTPSWPRPVTPDAVASAVCRAIEKDRHRVYVPGVGRLISLLPWILPDWLARRLGSWLGLRTLLRRVDVNARRAYRSRALAPPRPGPVVSPAPARRTDVSAPPGH